MGQKSQRKRKNRVRLDTSNTKQRGKVTYEEYAKLIRLRLDGIGLSGCSYLMGWSINQCRYWIKNGCKKDWNHDLRLANRPH